MDYTQLLALRQNHPTWRLLTAQSAPFIIGFFYYAFLQQNRRSIAHAELISLLEDFLYHIRQHEGEEAYPRTAKAYLEEWARGEQAFLRKYFPRDSDEAEFDLTPAAEQALEWLRCLEQKQFVGTESRMQTIYQLLHELVQMTETDPQVRIAELERQKLAIEQEIARLEGGATLSYDPTQVKERYIQIEDTARRLLADFRQVEENFRQLDREVREKITVSEQGKGQLLDEIFGDQDAIQDSDQGKSFRAFWAYLMAPQRQQDMAQMVDKMLALDAVQSMEPDGFLRQIRFHLLEAGEKVQRTSSSLVEQLRRYLDDKVWLENRRIMQLIAQVERHAVALNEAPPKDRDIMFIDATRAAIDLPMERGLFRPKTAHTIDQQQIEDGQAVFDSDALYDQHYVDTTRLRDNIRKALHGKGQVTLAAVCEDYPLQQGLSEIVCYMNIATQMQRAMLDSDQQQTLYWQDEHEQLKQAVIPLVIFTR